MFSYNNKKRRISLCFLLIGLTLITVFFLNLSSNDYSINPIIYRISKPLPRILCLILTTPKNFPSRVKAINDTWAPRCSDYYFITEHDPKNLTEQERTIANEVPIAPIGNITAGYDHLTQKSTLAFLFAHEKHSNEFDWFIKADDDTYLFVDHLQWFLSEQNASDPVTFGYNFKVIILLSQSEIFFCCFQVIVEKGYHSGGGSYVLSRESLRRFYEAHRDPKSECRKDGGSEDVEIAKCLRTTGVYPGKSLDKQNRELFHPLPFGDHFRGSFPDWLNNYAENPLRTVNLLIRKKSSL